MTSWAYSGDSSFMPCGAVSVQEASSRPPARVAAIADRPVLRATAPIEVCITVSSIAPVVPLSRPPLQPHGAAGRRASVGRSGAAGEALLGRDAEAGRGGMP